VSIFGKLFGSQPTETKASTVGAMLSTYLLGKPVWQQRDFAKIAKEGYQRNVIVYACVWMTAMAAADVPLAIMRRRGKSDGKTENADLEALLNRPNPMEDGIAWRKAVFADFLLGANAYIERVDVGSRPRELYRWRPDRVKVVPGDDGFPQAYEFSNNGQTKRIDIDIPNKRVPLLHWRDYNPTDDWYGMSAIDPASFAVDSHTSALSWNKALLDNSGQPSGALVYAPKEGSGKLTDEQWHRLKQELDASFSGSANAGKPLLLDGGLDWKEMGMTPKEMAFIDGKNSSARDIALCIGVPPLLLGIPGDNTFSNYTEANKAFYRQTVLPLVWQFCRAMNWWLADSFGQGISIEPDIDDLAVFADEREQFWDRIEKSTILTINEKREKMGYDKVDGGDVILVASSLVPLETAATPIEGGAEPEEDPADTDSGNVEEE